MFDKIEMMGKSVIQHGVNNSRIYLMKLDRSDYPTIIDKLQKLSDQESYGKIFTKIPEWAEEAFAAEGFKKEAYIPKFYNGITDTLFYSKFKNTKRAEVSEAIKEVINKNLQIAESKKDKTPAAEMDSDFSIKVITKSEVSKLTGLYSKVFDSYPFPIFDDEYILQTMDDNIVYFGAFHNNRLAAASSAEMDIKSENVEMTDFATDPEYAGNNLSFFLLSAMEAEMKKRGIKTFYTIARSLSPGMNITFAKQGYNFSGTLINNTNISGKIECMNVWYKNK